MSKTDTFNIKISQGNIKSMCEMQVGVDSNSQKNVLFVEKIMIHLIAIIVK